MSKYKNRHLELSKEMYSLTADRQAVKGLRTYGQGLDPLENGRDWLNMLDEEIIDAHQYLIAEMRKREFVIEKIRKLTDDKEINHWLDLLEGK